MLTLNHNQPEHARAPTEIREIGRYDGGRCPWAVMGLRRTPKVSKSTAIVDSTKTGSETKRNLVRLRMSRVSNDGAWAIVMPKAEQSSERKTKKRRVSSKSDSAVSVRSEKRTAGRIDDEQVGTASTEPASIPHAAGVAAKPKRPARKAKRLAPRKTFLVAVTIPEGFEEPGLHVYAVLVREPAEALSTVRDQLGEGIHVELTGKLSGRISKTLGLRPDEIRRI